MLIEITDTEKEQFTPTELIVIDWLNEHENKIYEFTISEIADKTFTSPATVSKTIKKCGFSGIAQLRFKASSKNHYIEDGKVANEVINNLLEECKETIENITVDTILQIIHHIKTAKKIYLIARGNTALIARYFEFQLQLLGYSAFVLSDALIMQLADKLITKDDVVIIFTVKNSTPELEIAARHAKDQEATVITCCCTKGTSLEQYSDVYAYCRQKNTHVLEGFDMMSNLPLHLISRIIIDYLML